MTIMTATDRVRLPNGAAQLPSARQAYELTGAPEPGGRDNPGLLAAFPQNR